MTPYQRIVRAAGRKTGMRLSAHEVALLALDDAVETAVARDDERETEAGRLLQERGGICDQEHTSDPRAMREPARRRVAKIDVLLGEFPDIASAQDACARHASDAREAGR